MNAERREKLVSLAKKHSGKFTKDVRGARKNFMNEAKKAVKEGVSKDEGKRREKEGEAVVKEYQGKGEAVTKKKIDEINDE